MKSALILGGRVDKAYMIQMLRPVRPLVIALVFAVALKLFYIAISGTLAPVLPIGPERLAANGDVGYQTPQSGSAEYRLSGVWERFDTMWYVRVADEGYKNPAATVFFPGYPALIRLFTPVFASRMHAALAVSFAGAVLLFWALLRLVELDFGRDIAVRTLVVIAAWPASFILFAGYPDSLVMGLMLAAIYLSRTGRNGLAIPVGLLAGLTKSVGVFAGIPLAIYAWRARSWKGAVASVAPSAGYFAYSLYLRSAGLPPLTETYAAHWRTRFATPWETLAAVARGLTAQHTDPMLVVNLVVLATVIFFLVARPIPLEYSSFGFALILLFLVKKTDDVLMSTARYVVLVFPAFVNLARTKDWAWTLLLPVALNLLLLVAFLEWSFVV